MARVLLYADGCWPLLACTAGALAGSPRRRIIVAGHTTGGRPSKVILTTVRQRICCRAGRADHASR
jgi:hypothetical protein